MEVVYQDLDHGDQDEFKSMGEAMHRKRIKRAVKETEEDDPQPQPKRKAPRMKPRKRPAAAPLPLLQVAAEPPLPAAAAPPLLPPPPPLPPPVQPPPEPLVAPEPPAAPHEHARGPNVMPMLQWTDVICQRCHQLTAQKKFHPNPGNRDGPCWILRRCVLSFVFVLDLNAYYPQAKNTYVRVYTASVCGGIATLRGCLQWTSLSNQIVPLVHRRCGPKCAQGCNKCMPKLATIRSGPGPQLNFKWATAQRLHQGPQARGVGPRPILTQRRPGPGFMLHSSSIGPLRSRFKTLQSVAASWAGPATGAI